MKFDTILIGGGLSSLVCGIRLQKAGRRCLVVSAGQNALHFSSGTFGLLGRLPDGTKVIDPLEDIPRMPGNHPYSKIGQQKMAAYCAAVPEFFAGCGINLHPAVAGATVPRNGYRLTPMGTLKPAWLAMKDTTLLPSRDALAGGNALIVNFAGFLDFNSMFIAEGLEKKGISCRLESVRIDDVERLRKNPSEMRSVGIARLMDKENNWKEFARRVKELLHGEDMVILPEVFGLRNEIVTDWLREMIPAQVQFVGTMPPSVPGIRAQLLLKKAYEDAGGTFLMGDTALAPRFDGGRVKSIRTANLGEVELEANHFVLASGGFFGRGLESDPSQVTEPVFHLDVDYPVDRSLWCDPDFFARQEYAGFGVATDGLFRGLKDGVAIENLHVAGSEVGGCNSQWEGSGAGVAILTAMSVADNILAD